MGDEQPQQIDWARPTGSFQPSARLCGRLLWGALATILSGALSVAALAAGNQQTRLILDLVSLLPLAVMLWTYLLLAREVGSLGLRRTMLGMLGVAGLISLADLAQPEFMDKAGAIAVAIAIAVLTFVLLCVIGHRPAWANPAPASGDESSDASSGAQKAGWGGGVGGAFLAFMLFKLFARVLRNVKLDQDIWVALGAGALLLLFVIFAFIAGIVKLRLGNRLGMTSMLLGLTELLVPLVIAALLGWLGMCTAEVAETAGPDEADIEAAMDQAYDQWAASASKIAIGVHSVWTIMTLLFFWTVRSSADPDEVLSNEFEA